MAVEAGGYVYTSADSGTTWTEQVGSGLRAWSTVASSADGNRLVAGAIFDYVYTSADGGVTWTQQTSASAGNWSAVASSASGARLAAGNNGSTIRTAVAPVEPDAPTSLIGTAGDGRVQLSWAAPTDDGGSAITDYTVEYRVTGSGSWSTFSHAASTAMSASITGLTNGTSYDFRVSAVNSIGTGAPSAVIVATPSVQTPPASGSPGEDDELAATGADATLATLVATVLLVAGSILLKKYF